MSSFQFKPTSGGGWKYVSDDILAWVMKGEGWEEFRDPNLPSWEELTDYGEMFADGIPELMSQGASLARDLAKWERQGWWPNRRKVSVWVVSILHRQRKKAFQAEFKTSREALKRAEEAIPKVRRMVRPSWLLPVEGGPSPSRVASSYFRQACIISTGEWGGRKCLLKNRDRNYEPQLKIVHEVRGGVEVAYVRDEVTGWVEGLNEFGIGVVNSALQVGRDEAEKKIVQVKGRKSKDGPRILRLLESRTLDEAVESAQTYEGGIKGHTLIADPEKTYSLEMTRRHEAHVQVLPEGKIFVRTNHGLYYDDAGYTEGPDYTSSIVRREKAQRALRQVEHPDDIPFILMEKRMKDREHPNNLVRDTEKMRTTSQLILNLTDRELVLYLIPGKVKFEGYENKLPKGLEAKINVRVVEYIDIDGDGTPDVKRIKLGSRQDAYFDQISRMSLEEFAANPPPGFRFDGSARFTGHRPPDRSQVTVLGPDFFRHDADTRKYVLYHEIGHDLMRDFNRDWLEVLEPHREDSGPRPTIRSTYDNPYGASTRPEEFVADIYAAMFTGGERWYTSEKYAALFRKARELAAKYGLPLP